MQSNAPPACVTVQLLPDWTPSSVDPLLARFDALCKIPRGFVLDDIVMQLVLLDDRQRALTIKSTTLTLGKEDPLVGPSWKIVRGGLMKLTPTTTHACAIVSDVRSAPAARLDATIPVLLRAIDSQVGADGEPHLWWRFYNHSAMSIPVAEVFDTMTLQIDEQTFPFDANSYDGPALLPSHRSLSGLWSLDEFDPRMRTGLHRFRLIILGEASEPLVFEWQSPL